MTFLETYIHFIQFLVFCQQILWYTCRLIVSMAEILLTLNSVLICIWTTRIFILAPYLQQMTDSLKGNKVFPKCPQPPSKRPCIELGDLVSQWAPASQFVADVAWFCYFSCVGGYSGSLIGPPVWFQVPAVIFSLRKDIKRGAFMGERILPRLMDL